MNNFIKIGGVKMVEKVQHIAPKLSVYDLYINGELAGSTSIVNYKDYDLEELKSLHKELRRDIIIKYLELD